MKDKTKLIVIMLILLSALLVKAESRDRYGVTKSFTVVKGSNVNIELMQSSIRIDTWNKDEVLVRLDGEGNDEELEDYFKFSQKNNTLLIASDLRNGWDYSADIRVTVPKKINVTIKANFGDVIIGDDITGNVKISSNGGEIKTANINGDFTAYTAGGDIRGGDISGKINTKTNGGELIFGVLSGSKIFLETLGGDIRIKKATKYIQLNTMGGDIRIGDVDGGGDLITHGGDINTGELFGEVKLKTLGGDINVKSAKGSIIAESSGGDIRISKITGSIQTKTMAGDVHVELNPQGATKSVIKSSSGDVYLYIPSNARITIEAELKGYNSYDDDGCTILSDFESFVTKSNKKNYTFTKTYEINGGGSPKVYIEANYSDIKIKKLRN